MRIAAKILGAAHCLMGLVFIGISIPLILKRVAMNQTYGVRIPKAFESEANWYAINYFGGWVLVTAGALICLVGAVLILRPPQSLVPVVLASLAPVPIVLLSLLPIFLYAKGLG